MAGGAIYPDLDGRTVLVTGGGSGIGAAIVRAFARQKSKVGFIDIADAPSRASPTPKRCVGLSSRSGPLSGRLPC
jgi:NAD(P)-dependent dehydrogenase (short-subunit alcohol dehydrogenase family)